MIQDNSFLTKIRWNQEGLVPAIIQDHKTQQVLMFAWMNSESLSRSIQEGRTVFWSRSRQELWAKGETSGAVQNIKRFPWTAMRTACLSRWSSLAQAPATPVVPAVSIAVCRIKTAKKSRRQ